MINDQHSTFGSALPTHPALRDAIPNAECSCAVFLPAHRRRCEQVTTRGVNATPHSHNRNHLSRFPPFPPAGLLDGRPQRQPRPATACTSFSITRRSRQMTPPRPQYVPFGNALPVSVRFIIATPRRKSNTISGSLIESLIPKWERWNVNRKSIAHLRSLLRTRAGSLHCPMDWYVSVCVRAGRGDLKVYSCISR
jgi:hypothetical protein